VNEGFSLPRLVVGGTQSGAGKTTVTVGLLDGLRRRGFRVQPYKIGPDFIDPSLHELAAGRPSSNLDSFLFDDPTFLEVFQRAALSPRADVAVIEGMMGLFDGYSGGDERGSAAHAAKRLKAPVLLVADASAYARTLGAVVEGFLRYDPAVSVAGVFLNNVGGTEHLKVLEKALARRAPLLGWMFRDPLLRREERHLGLVPAAERRFSSDWLSALRRQMDRQVDWRRLLSACRAAPPLRRAKPRVFRPAKAARCRIAVARDAAFCFYYRENLDLLEQNGAELAPFSPLEDGRLPPSASGVYIGGGYPELHARALERNKALRARIRAASRAGMPIYGECGGLMYLGGTLTDAGGRRRAMVGALPLDTRMEDRLKLAYVRARVTSDGWILPKGAVFPGHIFHFSAMRKRGRLTAACRLEGAFRGGEDGYRVRRTMAGYLHAHFASAPALAANFAAEAERFAKVSR
jgi:cobyrinic acid a,c-diamide synthase